MWEVRGDVVVVAVLVVVLVAVVVVIVVISASFATLEFPLVALLL